VNIVKGAGNFTIFSISNETYTPVKTFYIAFGSTVSLGNSLATSVSSSLFSYGTEYSVEYSGNAVSSSAGSNLIIPRGNWTFYVKPYVLEGLVVVINSGTRGMEVRKGEALRLDASRSYDPSADYVESFLVMNWTCFDFSVPYTQYSRTSGSSWIDFISSVSISDPTQTNCGFWNYINPPAGYLVTVSDLNESDKVYRFTFTLSDQGTRTRTRDIFIRVVPSSFNPVSLSNPPTYKINTDKDLQLFVKDAQTTENSIYKWSCQSSGTLPSYLTDLDSWVLSIASNSLSPNSEYTFAITYSDMNTKSSSVVSIQTNSPPHSGSLSIDKSSGTSLLDSFTVQMIGWLDEDLPLSYSFMLFANYSSSGYFLTGLESSSVWSGYFAGGSLKLAGFCYDALGSRSSSNVTLSVSSLRNIQKILEELDSLSSAVDETSVFQVLSGVQAFVKELNYSFQDLSVVIKEKKLLFAMVKQCKVVADNLYARDESSDAIYMYVAISAVSKDFVLYPVDSELVNSVLELVNSIDFDRLDANPVIYPGKNSSVSVTSPQGLLRREEINEVSLALAEIVNLASWVEGDVDVSLVFSIVDRLATVFATGTVITEQAKILKTETLAYFSTKDLLGNLEDKTIEIKEGSSVKIPTGISKFLNTTQVNLFTAVVDSNPFSDNSVTLLDQYMRVELRNIQTGETLKVSGLSKPFILTFNVSRNTLEQVRAHAVSKFNSAKLMPECSFWTGLSWSYDGCSLSNIGEIYSYFDYQSIPETFSIVCSCNHLSQFSVNFYSTQQVATTSFIIKDDDSESFETDRWECSVVFFILISGLVTFIVTLSLAYYWDNYNPGLSTSSIETEKTFHFWDPNRVETVLTELQKDFINQLSESRKGEKQDSSFSRANLELRSC
jgi:hypothetical protein